MFMVVLLFCLDVIVGWLDCCICVVCWCVLVCCCYICLLVV